MPTSHQNQRSRSTNTRRRRRPHATEADNGNAVNDEILSGDDFDADSAKMALASKLNALLGERRLSQSAAAQLLGMSQPRVSAIRNYKLHGISLERLLQALLAMGQQVEIVVKPHHETGDPAIRVTA
ncbi:helix-turn-helix domain-containing protein [Burkholderia cepacia]|uniref:helix-turn-helix domain-containing protein n=1 Tax=Burkholderia cepacia TaxID=292 RepID=UPI00158E83C5|nr:helix-turn-helix transcriptional regulator [Burkholderia cepacia]MCA8318548.1 helix-turn-helix domain-containing protein [Burkholderia cepacia]